MTATSSAPSDLQRRILARYNWRTTTMHIDHAEKSVGRCRQLGPPDDPVSLPGPPGSPSVVLVNANATVSGACVLACAIGSANKPATSPIEAKVDPSSSRRLFALMFCS
jgi:hypothetical protein